MAIDWTKPVRLRNGGSVSGIRVTDHTDTGYPVFGYLEDGRFETWALDGSNYVNRGQSDMDIVQDKGAVNEKFMTRGGRRAVVTCKNGEAPYTWSGFIYLGDHDNYHSATTWTAEGKYFNSEEESQYDLVIPKAEPLFERGKSYKTRDGNVAVVNGSKGPDDFPLSGYLIDEDGDKVFCSWSLTGRYVSEDEENSWDLMPNVNSWAALVGATPVKPSFDPTRPLMLRDGRDVELYSGTHAGKYPLHGCFNNEEGDLVAHCWTINGKACGDAFGYRDLVNKPEEPVVRWTNAYQQVVTGDVRIYGAHNTEEHAKRHASIRTKAHPGWVHLGTHRIELKGTK